MLFVFFVSSRVKLSHTEDSPHHLLLYVLENFAMGICRENLPWLFAARICRGYLPREFAARRGFFIFVSKSFFICVSKSCLYESKPFFICEKNFFICEIFFINSVSFCYCRGSYGPPYFFPSPMKSNYIHKKFNDKNMGHGSFRV